jgi:hypothetical protein
MERLTVSRPVGLETRILRHPHNRERAHLRTQVERFPCLGHRSGVNLEPLGEGDPVAVRRYRKPAPKLRGGDNAPVTAGKIYTDKGVLAVLAGVEQETASITTEHRPPTLFCDEAR